MTRRRMQWFNVWWATLSDGEKILFGIGIPVLGVFFRFGVPAMIRYLYLWILDKLDAAEEELRVEAKKHFATPIGQPEHKIIEKSGVWPWLARRAFRWRKRNVQQPPKARGKGRFG
jgi:hypothetical protein